MEEFENYFKNRKEIEEFFTNEVFKFSHMSDNRMFFESLNPVFLGDCLVSFSLSFYFEEGKDFFAYSSFKDWLEKFQLSEVTCTVEETSEYCLMYFRTYADPQE